MKHTLTIFGRRWFQRTNGNSYFSARAYLDGELIGNINFAYGYGDHYRYEMLYALELNQKIPARVWETRQISGCDPIQQPAESWLQWSERTGISIVSEVADVGRKRDL